MEKKKDSKGEKAKVRYWNKEHALTIKGSNGKGKDYYKEKKKGKWFKSSDQNIGLGFILLF